MDVERGGRSRLGRGTGGDCREEKSAGGGLGGALDDPISRSHGEQAEMGRTGEGSKRGMDDEMPMGVVGCLAEDAISFGGGLREGEVVTDGDDREEEQERHRQGKCLTSARGGSATVAKPLADQNKRNREPQEV